jgi:prophage DNA circulation protein
VPVKSAYEYNKQIDQLAKERAIEWCDKRTAERDAAQAKVESLTRDNEALLKRCGELNNQLLKQSDDFSRTVMALAKMQEQIDDLQNQHNRLQTAIEGFSGMLQRQIDELSTKGTK